ncbi:uncharacterized protein BYT42DRAFT_384365 [Radiomyces spectabilis]|uniref:uncharacterized protein n=1 Tax=Radiomyces spectabilis TaxID=64574 RepID=UPI00221FE4D8|nr:uncharacterized protein BYT42DRAFT_384365 [Radiomyces spectabilis]KAI8376362.1 hypothetical protein BYT42DRAFT_384365 [Radiomyces spectabilis]
MVAKVEFALLAEWSDAIDQADLKRIQTLLSNYPLLISVALTPTFVHDDLQNKLASCPFLGSTVENLNALQYLLAQPNLDHPSPVISFLLEQTSVQLLETQVWGNERNTTMHLASFLGYQQVLQQMVSKGVAVDIANDLGYLPADVTSNEALAQWLTANQSKSVKNDFSETPPKSQSGKKPPVQGPRPNYSTSSRFRELQALAESSALAEKKKVSGPSSNKKLIHVRSGHVEQTLQKVTSEEEEKELQRERARRQKEVSLLVKRSAVKNNPFLKMAEQKQQQLAMSASSSTSTPGVSSTEISAEDDATEIKPKRNSKVISSLKHKSCVSSSVFRQTETTTEGKPLRSPNLSPSPSTPNDDHPDRQLSYLSLPSSDHPPSDTASDSDSEENDDDDHQSTGHADHEIKQAQQQPALDDVDSVKDEPQKEIQTQKDGKDEDPAIQSDASKEKDQASTSVIRATLDITSGRRLSGSQKAHWSLGTSAWAAALNKEFNLEALTNERLVTTTATAKHDDEDPEPASTSVSNDKSDHDTEDEEDNVDEDNDNEEEDDDDDDEASYDGTIRVYLQSVATHFTQRECLSDDGSGDSHLTSTFSSRRGSIVDSMDTWPPPSPLASRSDSPKREKPMFGTISVRSTARYVSRLPPSESQIFENDDDEENEQVESNSAPSVVSADHSTQRTPGPYPSTLQGLALPTSLSTSALCSPRGGKHGKLYIRVNGVHDILVPLPAKERAYVRCIVSDGRYEYMSRYELLAQHIVFDYECMIDTHPDMILSISLHVRPDYIVKSKPITRLFTSTRKRKESLSGYIHHEDGALGQTRFALAHMLSACYQKPYAASFHCFNAWYTRSPKERHRQRRNPNQDVLKVVGNFDVEMLYLPVSDPSLPIPRSLRECDMAIKIRQWNETCWPLGYSLPVKMAANETSFTLDH